MDEVQILRKALADQRSKQKALKHQLKLRSRELACISDPAELSQGNYQQFIQREEENITNTLQKVLHNIVQQKVQLEQVLEQQQEYIVNTMSRQVAQALAEKLQKINREFKRQLESRSLSSDPDSNQESFTDSSFSSDSQSGQFQEKRKLKLMETELACIKQQMRLAKREVRKYKQLYTQLVASQNRLVQENQQLGKKVRSECGSDRSGSSASLNSSLFQQMSDF